jgi:hypothetical protein
VISLGIYDDKVDITKPYPPTLPPLTGTLELHAIWRMEPLTRRLLGLPGGVRFRKLECTWNFKDDVRCTMAMVEGCSDTLECIEITCNHLGEFHPFHGSGAGLHLRPRQRIQGRVQSTSPER